MKCEEYTVQLRDRLRGLSDDEINDAIRYCEEYFNEAESEEAAMADLGTPAKFAAQLRADTACRMAQDPLETQKPRSLLKNFLMIMTGICALPIALPLLLMIVLLIFAIGMVLLALVLSAVVMVVCLFYAAAAAFVSSLTYAQGAGDICIHLGASLICLGVGILAILAARFLLKTLVPTFIQAISSFYQRHKGGVCNEI